MAKPFKFDVGPKLDYSYTVSGEPMAGNQWVVTLSHQGISIPLPVGEATRVKALVQALTGNEKLSSAVFNELESYL